MNSKVLGSTEFNSELRFPIVYGPSLRSASVLTLLRSQPELTGPMTGSYYWYAGGYLGDPVWVLVTMGEMRKIGFAS